MWQDYAVRYRSPNTEDIAGCAGLEPAASRRKLLACCVTDARCQGKSVSAEELPEDVAQKVVEQIAAIDPQADMRLDLTCPECHQRWNEVFDIVSFFWAEIDAWARRILREVNVLARAYGWRESDILALESGAPANLSGHGPSMTDFLTSLTARSFGTETAIRPRVASLFEPVRNGDVGLRDAPASQSVETAIHREVNVESDGERKMSHPAPALQEDRKVSDAKQSADESPVAAMVPPRGDSERRRTTVLADETREKEDKVVVAKVRPRKAPLSQDNADESEPAAPESEAFAPKHVPARTPAGFYQPQ